jgi:hypothetical protein
VLLHGVQASLAASAPGLDAQRTRTSVRSAGQHTQTDAVDPRTTELVCTRTYQEEEMKKALMYPFAITVLVALASGTGSQAAARTPEHAAPTTHETTSPMPFNGTLEGRHVSRSPVDPTVVFDRFETEGQALQLGHFTLVIEATVDFGTRPVTGSGTYTFTAANGDLLVAAHTGFSALVEPGTVLITERATIDPDRSTGRFAGAHGTFTTERLADAATGVGGLTVGTFEGEMSLRTGGRATPGSIDEGTSPTPSR